MPTLHLRAFVDLGAAFVHDVLVVNQNVLDDGLIDQIARKFGAWKISSEIMHGDDSCLTRSLVADVIRALSNKDRKHDDLVLPFRRFRVEFEKVEFSRGRLSVILTDLDSIFVDLCERRPVLFPMMRDVIIRRSEEEGSVKLESSEIFVVHGNDPSNLRHEVARFVESLNLSANILSEKPNRGMAIIEKLEAHGVNQDFCIVLMTPDDEGNRKGERKRKRARQNVVLELGYFLSLLGRDRVACVVAGDIELPSDIHGVVYIDYEAADWQRLLAREMKESGLSVDPSKLF